MNRKEQITNIEDLVDWITTTHRSFGVDIEDNGLYVQSSNNSDVFINIKKDDEIEDIISRTIETLESFDADEKFTELWNKEFAEHNHFTPTIFLRMLKEDERNFRYLARKLEKLETEY